MILLPFHLSVDNSSKMNLPHTASEWLARADDARTLAGEMSDPRAKQMMTDIAVRYERLARYVTSLQKRLNPAPARRHRRTGGGSDERRFTLCEDLSTDHNRQSIRLQMQPTMTTADWLRRAADSWTEADAIADPELRKAKVLIAEGCERLAKHAAFLAEGDAYPPVGWFGDIKRFVERICLPFGRRFQHLRTDVARRNPGCLRAFCAAWWHCWRRRFCYWQCW